MNAAVPISTQPGAHQPVKVWSKVGGVLLLYGLLAILLTYPVCWQINQAAAGFDGRDSWQHVWYQWWLKETLLDLGVWPDRVTQLYYPLGADHPVLALHPYVPLVSLPLTLFFGPLVSYNGAFLLSFILAGLTGYLLCRYVAGHTGAAVLGGLIFAFYPNRMGHAAAGHLLLTTNYFLPLYALSLLLLLRRPSAQRAVWHGVITALLALAQPTHFGYGIIPVFLFLVGGYLLTGYGQPAGPALTKRRLRSLLGVVAAAGLALLIIWPFAWPLLDQSQQGELGYLTPTDLTQHSTDLLAFLLPSPYNPILVRLELIPAYGATIIAGLRDLEEQLAYLGLAVLALAGAAIWKRWQEAWVWLGLAAVSGLLSLGPWLKIGGAVQSLGLPYLWLTRLPFFAWSRAPGRLNETVMLAVAVLAALGAAWLFGRIRGRKMGVGYAGCLWLGGVGLLVMIEYWVIFPFPTEVRPISSYYSQLGQEELSGGILELPVTGSRRASNYAMYYQTVHQHPLAGGYIERDPPGTVELKEFLNQLVSPIGDQTVLAAPAEAERRAIMANLNIHRVIARPALMTDRAARQTLAYLPGLLGGTIFEDEDMLVYPVQADHRELTAWSVLPDQANWELVNDGATFRLKKQGYLFIYAAQGGITNLTFQPDSLPTATTLSLKLNDSIVYEFLLDSTAEERNESLTLPPGLNYIRLTTEPPQDIDFYKISVQSR